MIFSACNSDKKIVVAKKGEINFTNWNFDTDGIVKLDGEWEFYPNKLINNKGIATEKNISYLEIPSSWKDVEINNEKLNSFGYATYKLKIIPNKQDSVYSISIARIDVAYKLWINDKLILQAGEIAKNKQDIKPEWLSQSADFKINSDTLILIMQVANYNHRKAGITSSIKISTPKNIEFKEKKQLSYDFFLLGLLLIMAIYHLGLFLLRRIDLSTIYFALMLFFVALHHTVVGDYLIKFLFPDINWLIVVKIDFIANYLRLLFFSLFIWFMFKKDVNIWYIRALTGISIVMILLIIFTPPTIFTFTFIIFIIILLLGFLYLVFASFRATIKKRDGAIYSLSGTLILLLALINDWLYASLVINTLYLVPFAIFIFILLQSFMISLRFSKSFNRSEKLSNKLINLTQTLEHKVQERTSEIEQQKEELQTQTFNLLETNEQHQTTNELLIFNKAELEETNEELNQQKEELRTANEELSQQTKELNQQKEELRTANEELSHQKEKFRLQAENLQQINHAAIETHQILEQQNAQIQTSNQKMTDSIQYAKRIQKAIIPPPDIFADYFQEYFVLLKPKDIVSGDFYFFEEVNDNIIFIAADCTGHGVPGGFMSMLSMTLIIDIIKNSKTIIAGEFLNQLRNEIIISLNQQIDNTMLSDGLDIAFCMLNRKTKELQFSGAYHPLVYIESDIENPKMHVIKGDRMPIGKYRGANKLFTTHNIQLKANDIIYLYSDGFQDQYGAGRHRGKFLSRKFRELLFQIHQDKLFDQKELLINILETNIEENERANQQTDDVLILGLKI